MRIPLVVAGLVLLPGCLAPIADTFRASDILAPEWRVGDWWRYRLSSDVYQTEAEVTVVVANETTDGYVLGTPSADDVTFALLQHLPAIGPIRDDLAWDVHGTRFVPLEFPLEDDKEWDTTWISAEVHLRAKLENGTWNVTNEGFEQEAAGLRYDIVYDPAVKWFQSFTRTGAADDRVRQRIELLESGSGYVGEVRTVGNIQVALLQARTAGGLGGGLPAAPNPTFTVPAGADTLLAGCLAGGAPGQYHAEVRSPTGVVCQLDASIPPGDLQMRATVIEAAAEEGTWEARLVAGGSGSAIAEVLAYSTSLVTLA